MILLIICWWWHPLKILLASCYMLRYSFMLWWLLFRSEISTIVRLVFLLIKESLIFINLKRHSIPRLWRWVRKINIMWNHIVRVGVHNLVGYSVDNFKSTKMLLVLKINYIFSWFWWWDIILRLFDQFNYSVTILWVEWLFWLYGFDLYSFYKLSGLLFLLSINLFWCNYFRFNSLYQSIFFNLFNNILSF